MKASLQFRLKHQLKLTPQLQQSIRLLQLSTLDLRDEIQQQIESNPLLEGMTTIEAPLSSTQEYLEQEDEFDYQWSTLYPNSTFYENDEPDAIYETLHCATTNLQDHLRWQLNLTPMSDIDRSIATTIIDAVNDAGFLTLSIKELHTLLNSKQWPISPEEVQTVIHQLQRFDPVGCVTNTVQETLLVQLEQLSLDAFYQGLLQKLIKEDLEYLGFQQTSFLLKKYSIEEETLTEALQIIQSLTPCPGNLIDSKTPEYVIPDLVVKKKQNQWHVHLNQNLLPKLNINHHYASLIKDSKNKSEHDFLKTHLQQARWLLKSLQSRKETLLRVANYIINYQEDFLERGDTAMRPLTLDTVANDLNLHESTVSRATTQKFIDTPQGVFELKYFFSSRITTNSNEEFSSKAIQALIKHYIDHEEDDKPLSDNEISRLLEQNGIKAARRTVAKYREYLNIPPSYERKLFRH